MFLSLFFFFETCKALSTEKTKSEDQYTTSSLSLEKDTEAVSLARSIYKTFKKYNRNSSRKKKKKRRVLFSFFWTFIHHSRCGFSLWLTFERLFVEEILVWGNGGSTNPQVRFRRWIKLRSKKSLVQRKKKEEAKTSSYIETKLARSTSAKFSK